MVSTEYPPMPGGVGRYTANLTESLKRIGIDMYVVCNEKGAGNFSGLSPENTQNSDVLLKITSELQPDIVHIQFEPGLYGFILDAKDPRKSGTYIDSFYHQCKIPIVTTFHTGYTLRQWLRQGSSLVKKTGKTGRFGIPARASIRLWKYFLNYQAFSNLNKGKLALSKAGITFSNYMSKMIGRNCHVIYHGSQPTPSVSSDKKQARKYFGLPTESRIALAAGFRTVTKGWDIIPKLELPKEWVIVTNSSKSHYNVETLELEWERKNKVTKGKDEDYYYYHHHHHSHRHDSANGLNIIDLQRGFLSEKELSLLFYASDVLLLPYKVTAASGVMFDGLAHGVPFVASNLGFFKEFAAMGLGIISKREPIAFTKAIMKIDTNHEYFTKNVNDFRQKLRWDFIAEQHAAIYQSAAAVRQGVQKL
jgi:glycosyltransferase involved in cell wall biosynthesis